MLNTNISVLVTSKCTLNCEFCSSGIPYHANAKHISAKELVWQIREVLALYEKAEIYVEHLDLLGGEPFLHPQLKEIIENVGELSAKFHELRILTNGTVVPQREIFEKIASICHARDMRFLLILSDYGPLSSRKKELLALLEEYNLRYRIDKYNGDDEYCGGWVSYGQDGIIEGTIEERYLGCAFCSSGVAEVFDGVLYPCTRALALHSTGRRVLPKEEYIDLYDSFEENRSKLLGFWKRPIPYMACNHCTGLTKNAKRYPAAKQM